MTTVVDFALMIAMILQYHIVKIIQYYRATVTVQNRYTPEYIQYVCVRVGQNGNLIPVLVRGKHYLPEIAHPAVCLFGWSIRRAWYVNAVPERQRQYPAHRAREECNENMAT